MFDSSFFRDASPLLDSRQLQCAETSIFFALRGQHQDGHRFVPALYAKGLRRFVVERQEPDWAQSCSQAQFLVCPSPLRCLQDWAAWHRQQFSIPVMGITGSNAKTILKEWLGQCLEGKFRVVKSPKSYNSQIGVPLSVLQLRTEHELAIFEAGISQPGEMQHLARIIQPNIGLFTNLGSAHDEGFVDRREKLAEKLKLFEHCPVLIYCADQTALKEMLEEKHWASEKTLLSWGRAADATIPLRQQKLREEEAMLDLVWQGQALQFFVPFRNQANLENLSHLIVCLLYLGLSAEEIQEKVKQLSALPMRLAWKAGIRGCYLIDDTYNNDFQGLQMALEFMQQKQIAKKTLILSDLSQTGQALADLYAEVAKLLQQYEGLDEFIGVGPALLAHREQLQKVVKNCHFFADTKALLEALATGHLFFEQRLILVKGARSFGLERVVQRLSKRSHDTVLELNIQALNHNLRQYKRLLRPQTKLMVMVKAFAYGSDSGQLARALAYQGVDYLGVAYVDEGVRLRQKGIEQPIMVMNPRDNGFDALVQYRLEPTVYQLSLLHRLGQFLRSNGLGPLSIHLEWDTGMHRLGFEEKDLEELVLALREYRAELRVVACFTHLAGADEEGLVAFSRQQIAYFSRCHEAIEQALGYPIMRHVLNSAGITRFAEEAQFEMVRLGIGLHGIDPNQRIQNQLLPVASFKTQIAQIKSLSPEETVGYNRKGQLQRPSRIATLSVGYADGYPRALGNGRAYVLIQGQIAPTVGNICMDMCFVDVTDIPQAQEGDEVVLFGEGLPIELLAKWLGTIPYEILTMVSGRIPRIFYEP
jgi:alanine racemase